MINSKKDRIATELCEINTLIHVSLAANSLTRTTNTQTSAFGELEDEDIAKIQILFSFLGKL